MARRVPVSLRDDIIQETGIRLLLSWHRLDSDKGAWGLARAIAIHAMADDASARDRHEVAESIELRDPLDLERAGIARFRLASVNRALVQMRPSDRRVLLAEVGVVSPPALGRSAMKMARSRARQRLRALVERPGSWAALPVVYLRHKMGGDRRSTHERALVYPHLAESAMAAIVAVTMTVTAVLGGNDSDGSLALDGIQGGGLAGIILSLTGGAGDTSDRSHRSAEMQAADMEFGSSPGYAEWNDDPLSARHTAEQVKKDAELQAEFLGGAAHQEAENVHTQAEILTGLAQQEAQNLGEQAEILAGLAYQEAENVHTQAEILAGLAEDEAKRTKQMAEDLPP